MRSWMGIVKKEKANGLLFYIWSIIGYCGIQRMSNGIGFCGGFQVCAPIAKDGKQQSNQDQQDQKAQQGPQG